MDGIFFFSNIPIYQYSKFIKIQNVVSNYRLGSALVSSGLLLVVSSCSRRG